MRYLYILLLLVLCSFQSSKKEKDYSKILPGLVKVTENLYYDATEVTNLGWLEYTYYYQQRFGKDSEEYLATLPDSNVWLKESEFGAPYTTYYLNHPAYRGYPVVGVSWEQAFNYCAWRTERVKEALEVQGKLDKAPEYFQYRLPTYQEWQMMYADVKTLDDKIGEEGKKAFRGMYRWNMKRSGEESMGVAGKLNDNADITAPAKSYWPNQYGVYNIKGNVSEWIMEPNTHVGGAWNTDMQADVSEKQISEAATSTVGFRCVCELAAEAP